MRDAALAIFGVTYLLLAVGRFPPFRLDRTGIAIVGAAAMILSGVVPLPRAAAAVDYRTLVLLFGMMIVVANLRLSGFFRLVTARVIRIARSPVQLLALTVAVAGVLAAFFINDVVCLVLAPLLLQMTQALALPPVPFLLALATASNIGSTATITGNPQNMLVASFSGLSYRTFALHLTPVAAIGLGLDFLVLWLVYRRQLQGSIQSPGSEVRIRVHRALLIKSSLTAGAAVILFAAGVPVSNVALGAGAYLLVTRRVRPEKVYRDIDWTLLVLFIGLFVVVAGLETTAIDREAFAALRAWRLDEILPLTVATTILSNLVSNVPAVMVLKPFVSNLENSHHAWLTVAAASTLAGNLTPLGSVANLIVIEQARRAGVPVSFGAYLRVGVPVTVLTLLVTIVVLAWE
ncbi:MAG: anion transporter [Candidatus Binatia bacterium]